MPVNRISDHVSLALTLAVLTIVLVCALSRLGAETVVETAPDGFNTITMQVEDGKVVSQSMTTVHVPADYVEGEKSAELITPEVQAAAAAMMGPQNAQAFLHAMRLNMLKYDADMRSQSGRRAWHGKLIREEIHTNQLVKVEVYSNEVDGTTWRYRLPFKPVQVKPTNRKVSFSTNGIPARLAAARARRAAQLNGGIVTTNIVTVGNGAAE